VIICDRYDDGQANIKRMLLSRYEAISHLFAVSCIRKVLALTPVWAKLSMQPESSDGFASVGTILPNEEAALLPGGFFAFEAMFFVC
jgi:hypothetical protein